MLGFGGIPTDGEEEMSRNSPFIRAYCLMLLLRLEDKFTLKKLKVI